MNSHPYKSYEKHKLWAPINKAIDSSEPTRQTIAERGPRAKRATIFSICVTEKLLGYEPSVELNMPTSD